ncbi:MAG: pilus assembly protein CpaE [Propionibacteriaceae bacterium]|nr:pilus assembly protein CpaE [Propionibacteriaceae bacterium]
METTTGTDPTVLVTGSAEIRERVLAAAATAGTEVALARDAGELAAGPAPGTLLVGADQVALVARSPLLGKVRAHLVGLAEDRDRLCEWSAALGAAVIVLPDGARWLAHALSGGGAGVRGTTIGLVGASGGLGTSSLAAGLARGAADRGHRVALVDLDPGGGGLDLLLGLETEPGWRWPSLASADGFLGDLHDHLPRQDALAVLSHDRDGPRGPTVAAAVAVLRSLARSHDLVLLDAGARPGTVELEAMRSADGGLMLCAGDVRGLAAATAQLRVLDPRVPLAVVLSRARRPGGLGRDVVSRALGVSVAATLPADKSVAAGADRGEPPGRTAGRAWRRCRDRLLDGMLEERP